MKKKIVIIFTILMLAAPVAAFPKIEKCFAEKTEILKTEIREKYGLNVYVGIYPENNGRYKDVSYSSIRLYLYIRQFEKILDLYSEEVISFLPDIYFISSEEDSYYQTLGEVGTFFGKPIYLTLNIAAGAPLLSLPFIETETFSDVVHHEIFHVIDSAFPLQDEKEYEAIDEPCFMISSYACTNSDEEQADAWAYSISGKIDSAKANYLHSYYDELVFK